MRAWPAMLAVALLLVPAQPALAGGGAGARADLGVYHTFDEMVSELQVLTAAHPDILRIGTIGKTYEGRDILVVKLSDNVMVDEAEPNITIFGGIHAGELIGVEVALYILEFLVGNYTTNSTVGWYVNSTQLWFVPMINPDGHVWVEQGNQWRKNRSPNPGGTFGTDLNRNFGHLWGLEASHNPADDDYCGAYAFSENETQAVSNLVSDHHPNITISYHAFGQYILYPWGNSINQEPVDPRLSQIAWNMSFAMPEGSRYLPMYAREMYVATGDTDDWFYMNLSILPFTIELSTSNRPLDSAVPGICSDNLGPVLYVLNYTVGAPPAPPPRHAISLDGPRTFTCLPGEEVGLDFTLNNTGDASEEVHFTISGLPVNWTGTFSGGAATVEPGRGTVRTLQLRAGAEALAGETAHLAISAGSASGANASVDITGTVGTVRSVELELDTAKSFPHGEAVPFPLSVNNLGNAFENLTLSAVSSAGWEITQVPKEFELPPRTATDTFIRVRVPSYLVPGLTNVNFTLSVTNRESTLSYGRNFTFPVETRRDLGIEPARISVNLTEGKEKVVSVRVTNNGNFTETGTLQRTGDTGGISLSEFRLELPPGANQTVSITIYGRDAGRWRANVSFVSDAGYPAVVAGVNYTVRSKSLPPNWPDYRPLLISLVIVFVVVVAVAAFLLWRSRKRPDDSGRKDPP